MSDVVIIGAGPAGLAAARSYRDCGGGDGVTLVSDEVHRPYRRPPLTKEFLRGEMAVEELALEQPDWFARRGIDLRLDSMAAEIDAARGLVHLADGTRLAAGRILLATGSQPVRPPIPGAEDPDVITLRRIGDAEELARRLEAGTRVAVIGSGFIGCEAACSLAMRGAEVFLVSPEALPLLPRLGEEAAQKIAGWLEQIGVALMPGAGVEAIAGARRVTLEGRAPLEVDIVLLGTGVEPRSELAAACGLELEAGAVATDSSLLASDPFFLAAGDVAAAYNEAAGRRLHIEHWGDAIGQGELAGRVMAGEDASWDAVPGFWSTIGSHTLKYAAWADGFDEAELVEHGDGAFTLWYLRDGVIVGVVTHERDQDYERARDLIHAGATLR